MPASSRLASGTDPFLAELVEEITTRLQAGADVRIEDYLARYPDQHEQLHRIWPTLQALADMGLSVTGPHIPTVEEPVLSLLGDFRIRREVGRGGMGIVYEAEQISLGRRVALKVLPFATALDAKQLHRFKQEAQAASQLHHSHIVPVYQVGNERGVHYYAMQFIDGQTAAELIHELRSEALDRGPGGDTRERRDTARGSGSASPRLRSSETAYFRRVATWGIEAAEALECAHEHGVIHRDIKPANLMIDVQGHLWVTDFGLAHCQNDAGLTMTGDLVGTLRFMSPEQAQARRGPVDHRTDIYSLGATLYELLTLHPAVDGATRQEVMRQICLEEPRPPRRWNAFIPVELETIVLKALNKSPESRYPTAQELADDLRRYLSDTPILAKRPSLYQKLVKFSIRHRAAVVTGTSALILLLLVSTIGLVISNRMISKESKEAQEARELAEKNEAIAVDQRDLALQTINLLIQSAQTKLNRPGVQEVRKEILNNAIAGLERLAEKGRGDDAVPSKVAAKQQLGDLLVEVGRTAEAKQKFEECRQLAVSALEAIPGDRAMQRALATSLARLAHMQIAHRDLKKAEELLHQLLEVTQATVKAYPDDQKALIDLSIAQTRLGDLYDLSGPTAKAREYFTQALALRERIAVDRPKDLELKRSLAITHERLADVCLTMGDTTQGGVHSKEFLRLGKELLDLGPTTAENRRVYATATRAMADYCNRLDDLIGTRKYLDESLRIRRELAADDPQNLQAKRDLATTYDRIGSLLAKQKDFQGAVREFEEVRKTFEEITAIDKENASDQRFLAIVHQKLGNTNLTAKEYEPALKQYARALEILDNLQAKGSPDLRDVRSLAIINGNMGVVYMSLGDLPSAHKMQRLAVERFEHLLKKDPDDVALRRSLASALLNLGTGCADQGDEAGAVENYSKQVEILQSLLVAEPDSSQVQRDVASARNRLALKLVSVQEDLRDVPRAVELSRKAVELAPTQGNYWNTLSLAYYRVGDWQQAIEASQKGISIHKHNSLNSFMLAMAYWQTGDKDKAKEHLADGLRLLEKTRQAMIKSRLPVEVLDMLHKEATALIKETS